MSKVSWGLVDFGLLGVGERGGRGLSTAVGGEAGLEAEAGLSVREGAIAASTDAVEPQRIVRVAEVEIRNGAGSAEL